jgi:hypothetical protein
VAEISDRGEQEDAAAVAADYVPLSAGNRPRRLTAAGKTFVYGKTPAAKQRLIFDQIAASLGMTPHALAAGVTAAQMNFEARLAMIRRYYERIHAPPEVMTLLDRALAAHKEEERELRLRRLSWNQPQAAADVSRKQPKRRKLELRQTLITATWQKVRPSCQTLKSLQNKSCPDRKDGDVDYVESFLLDNDEEFVASLRDQTEYKPDVLATAAHDTPSPSCSELAGSERVDQEEEENYGGWSLKTKPAPAGQTYRRAVLNRDEGFSAPGDSVAKKIETISDIFEDADSSDFSEILADYTRAEVREAAKESQTPLPTTSTSYRYQRTESPQSVSSLDGSDLLDQIFS